MNPIIVLACGTFDILHPGHEYYLKTARTLGTELRVIIARDTTVLKVKGKLPFYDERNRFLQVAGLPYVDTAYLGNEKDKYSLIEQIRPDIICLGYDQVHFTKELKSELAKRGLSPSIVRLKAHKPDLFKSSNIRQGIESVSESQSIPSQL